MKDGSYGTKDQSVIRFTCTECGQIMPMDIDIACEVLDRKRYKGKKVMYAYCEECEHTMYPLEIMEDTAK